MRSTEIVGAYWDEVWNAHDPMPSIDSWPKMSSSRAAERGNSAKDNVKNWIREFLGRVTTCTSMPSRHFRTRTAPALRPDGYWPGPTTRILGTKRDGQPIAMTGTAVWTVSEDGKLHHGWVGQASFELYHRLLRLPETGMHGGDRSCHPGDMAPYRHR